MPAQILRSYQQGSVDRAVEAWKRGARKVLLILPTAGGKTTCFAHIGKTFVNRGQRVLVNVHRRELATQALNRFREFGVEHGCIMADMPTRPFAPLQVASVSTLVRRQMPEADLVINDEAHLSTAPTWRRVLDSYPDALMLGVTATPWRMSGKPLASLYDEVVIGATPRELRELGALCNYTGFSYRAPDLSGVKTTAGEYNERQSAEAMSQSVIVDTIVGEYVKHARSLSAVVFAVTVEHSRQLTERFKAAGVAAEHLDGSTPTFERERILRRVDSGVTQVLCNVGVAVEGLDIPRLKCCILARPTKSLARFIQMVGRVRRPWNDTAARIHDHALNIARHGMPDADRDYSLSAAQEKPPPLSTCEVCLAIYTGPKCPSCDHENVPKPAGDREIQTVTEAEQFTFESGALEELEQDFLKPPVEVKWTTPGLQRQGRFLSVTTEQTAFGPRRFYLLEGERRQYKLPGTVDLDMRMRTVALKSLIRVTYVSEHAFAPGRLKKLFLVEVDDGR